MGTNAYTSLFVDFAGYNVKGRSTATNAINQGVSVGNTVPGDANGDGVMDNHYTITSTSGIPTLDRDGVSRSASWILAHIFSSGPHGFRRRSQRRP